MLAHARHLVIVEPGAPHLRVTEIEPERMHEMQRRAGIRAQPNQIARVRRNLRPKQDHVKHRAQS